MEAGQDEYDFTFYEYEYFDTNGKSVLKLPAKYIDADPFEKIS